MFRPPQDKPRQFLHHFRFRSSQSRLRRLRPGAGSRQRATSASDFTAAPNEFGPTTTAACSTRH